MFFKKGFTLIELLVVISIIGLLSSVILAAVSTARARAADTAVKQDLLEIANQAELVYQNTNSYDTLFGTDAQGNPTRAQQIFNAAMVSGHAGSAFVVDPAEGSALSCGPDDQVPWYVYVRLKSDPNTIWLVDGTGVSQKEDLPSNVSLTGCVTSTPVNPDLNPNNTGTSPGIN